MGRGENGGRGAGRSPRPWLVVAGPGGVGGSARGAVRAPSRGSGATVEPASATRRSTAGSGARPGGKLGPEPWRPGSIVWSTRARAIREVDPRPAYRVDRGRPDAPEGLGAVTHLGAPGGWSVRISGGSRHSYRLRPRAGRPASGWALVVFLHGNGGNFQALVPWVWRSVRRGGARSRSSARPSASASGAKGASRPSSAPGSTPSSPLADRPGAGLPRRGSPTAGSGVTRSARAHPGRYRGLIYVSPTMHRDELGRPGVRARLPGRAGRSWSCKAGGTGTCWQGTVDPAVRPPPQRSGDGRHLSGLSRTRIISCSFRASDRTFRAGSANGWPKTIDVPSGGATPRESR